MFGRGTADDKAGIIAHLGAIEAILKTVKELPINVKVLFEGNIFLVAYWSFIKRGTLGEEEVGSTHLEQHLAQNFNLLKSDVLILADTGNYDIGVPSITYRFACLF